MFTRGEFTVGNVTYGAIMSYTKTRIEAILVTSGTVVSAYLVNEEGSYSYNNVHAKELVQLVQNGVKACTSKNCSPVPFELGAMNQHEFIKAKVEYTMQMYRGEVVGAYIQSADKRVEMEYISDFKFPDNIPYIKLTEVKKNINLAESDLDAIQTRSVEEIALEKEDTSWLKNKQYFIVNDDETAEKLFTFFDNYNGPIAYDTETTGLKINCFGQINSKYQHDLEKYNEEHSDNPIRADKLVGIIFCVQENTSYYFPCFNRKFKNLYDDLNSPIRNRIINNTKAAYTIGAMRNVDNSVADYWRKTPADEITPDCILMERVRHILETKHIVCHNGSFEFKVGLQYWIDTNLKDDTMIIHQVAYKFRNGGGKAEPSNLKYLAKKELGVDQWELHDFFPNWKPDKEGLVRRKPGAKNLGTQIDFSYMDYPGTRVYAPTDGDVTLCLFHKFKSDLLKNHKEMEYIYNVEVIVACAIGYMEFFGHRIDESKILSARAETLANKSLIESEIRQMIDYSSEKEIEAYNKIKEFRENKNSNLTDDEHNQKLIDLVGELDNAIAENVEKQINLGSSAQVCDLFYNKLNIPCSEEKQSVAKKVVKGLMKEKDDEGKPKYPVVHLYSKYKNEETLLSKFFDNLIYFTYPGGFIFSSFGQIATNTGRMACIDEDTKIKVVGGDKKIKDMQVGDLVYCYDENGNIKIRKVLNVIDKGYKECIKLNWRSQGTHKEGHLICTPDHKILTKDNGWVEAQHTVGKRVFHLRRSNDKRPRLYGANGFCEQEQLVIKKEYFGEVGYNTVIHHVDENTTNNELSNLEIKSRSRHSSEHSSKLARLGRIKYDHLSNYKPTPLKGDKHPKYISITAEELRAKFLAANCIIKNLDMDFTTFKKKCAEVGYNYKDDVARLYPNKRDIDINEVLDVYIKNRYSVNATAKELKISRWKVNNILSTVMCSSNELSMHGIDDNTFIDSFMKNEGNVTHIANELGIHRSIVMNSIKRLDLCYNHNVESFESIGTRHVYDLEVDEYHNFIANEICVHNCSKPNCQQYPKVITKIIIPRDGYVMMDADYSQIEYRVLTAMAGNDWLAELFSDPDSDYHTLMASLMYGVDYSAVTSAMRSAAKSFNFGIPYGMGLGSLAILLTGKNTAQTRDEAAEKMEDYFANQPRTRKFFENVKEMAQVNGYTKTLFNRYRYYSFTDKDGNVNNAKKAAALRQAGNAVIQGCLDGDTRIQTKEFGIMKIKDLAGYSGEVWDGEKWSHGDILYSGKKQKCIITFNNGQKFICSPIHKFLVRSHRGTERFVDCKDLLTKENSKNPHRIVINKGYEPSDFKYSSEWAYRYKSTANNANNVFLEDIGDSFGIGVVLGRLASDGSVLNREVGASNILQYVAEHEKCIIPELSKYMGKLNCKYNLDIARANRNETMSRLAVYSKSLTNEVSDLDIKHSVNDNIFMDTELLRGFLRGFFDGDGGISGKTIALTFGTQFDFEDMCRDLQKALLFFGIRSRYYKYDYRYKLTIKTNDNQKFLDLIGFMNNDKQDAGRQLECVKDEHVFGPCLIPESVEITDEYIDMYDVCNTDDGYYVADGIITHNTAADIFKIGVARNFSFIRRNGLLGKLLIINMIHDEQLMEVDVQHLNMQRIVAEVGNNMQFKVDGFPPLYIGAGIGKAWGYAKGKMAEIHPVLLQQFTEEAKNIPIWRTPEEIEKEPVVDVHKVLDYFDHRVYEFRRKKVADYLSNPENWHKQIFPAISGLINLQFNYGRGDDAKAYTGPNGEKYTDQEFLELNIGDFLKENHIDADPSWFKATDNKAQDEEEDKEYSDGGDEDDIMDMVEGDEDIKAFKLVDESDKTFGSSIHDMINVFGACILMQQKICGINTKNMYYKKKDALIDYLMNYICDENDLGALQIVFLTDSNVLNYTGIYVKNLDNDELEKAYKSANSRSSDFTQGDVKNRSQAK